MEGAWQMMTELSNIYFDVCFSKVYLSSTIIKIKFHIFFVSWKCLNNWWLMMHVSIAGNGKANINWYVEVVHWKANTIIPLHLMGNRWPQHTKSLLQCSYSITEQCNSYINKDPRIPDHNTLNAGVQLIVTEI